MKHLRRLIRAFGPRALFGPIFRREMLVSGRKKFAHLSRFVLIVLMGFFVGVALYGTDMSSWGGSGVSDQINQMSMSAINVSTSTVMVLFIALPFVAAALGAGAITDERAARTFDSLLASPMSEWAIVASKLTSRTVQLLLLVLLTLPVLLAVRTYGGYSAAAIALVFLVTVAHGLMAASIAVYFSLTAKNARTAFIGAIVTLVGFNFIPVLVMLAVNLVPGFRAFDDEIGIALLHISPGAAVAVTLFGAADVLSSSSSSSWGVRLLAYSIPLASTGLMVLVSMLLAWRTASRLRVATVGKKKAKIKKAKATGESPYSEPSGGDKGRSRTVRGNPVLWRELASSFSGTSKLTRILCTLGVVALMALLYGNADLYDSGTHGLVYVIVVLVAFFGAASSTGSAVTSERESRSLDLLLTTPISARQILLGKLANAFFFPCLILIVPVVHTLITKAVELLHGEEFISFWLVLHLLMIVLPTYALLGASGLLFGVFFRRGMIATAANILLWLAAWLGVWVLLGMLSVIGPDSDALEVLFAAINPMYWLAMAIDGGTYGWSSRVEYDLDEIGFGGEHGPIGYTVILGVWSLCVLGVAAGFFFAAARVFARRTLRTR